VELITGRQAAAAQVRRVCPADPSTAARAELENAVVISLRRALPHDGTRRLLLAGSLTAGLCRTEPSLSKAIFKSERNWSRPHASSGIVRIQIRALATARPSHDQVGGHVGAPTGSLMPVTRTSRARPIAEQPLKAISQWNHIAKRLRPHRGALRQEISRYRICRSGRRRPFSRRRRTSERKHSDAHLLWCERRGKRSARTKSIASAKVSGLRGKSDFRSRLSGGVTRA
jgi:hypothetical protein